MVPPDLDPRPALFLDRDGVINQEIAYLHEPRDLVMIPGAGAVIADCNRLGVPVVVVTNQAGIGRGYYDVDAFWRVARAIDDELARDPVAPARPAHPARIDGWYFCAHRPDEDCPCRKPRPGLLLAAAAALGLDLSRSVFVGDKISDLEAGRGAGTHTVLVRTGYGRDDERLLLEQGRGDLFDACRDSLADARDVIRGLLGH